MERTPAKIPDPGWLRLAGGFAMAVGATVALGWVTQTEWLVRWLPSASHMVMNTALCVLLCGAGVLGLANARPRAAAACGAAAVALAGTVLMQFLLGRKLGVDEFFWKHPWSDSPLTPPGQMAPNASLALVLLGVGLVMLALRRSGRWLLPVVGGVVAAFALVPLLGFLTARIAGDGLPFRGMALPTMTALLVLAAALLRGALADERRESVAQSFMAAAFGMLVAVGVAAVQSNADVIGANNAVVRAYEVRGDIDHFLEEVARMESSSRAFALTGEDYFRLRAEERQAEVVARIESVQRFVINNADQAGRAARLRGLAEEKFTQNAELIRARQQRGAEAAADYLRGILAQPSRSASTLVNLADEMRADENRLLGARERERQARALNARVVQVLGSLMALGLLGASAIAARRAAAAREHAEAALRASVQMFQRLFESSPDAIVLVGRDGRIARANTRTEALFGWAAGALDGQPLEVLLPERFRARHGSHLAAYFQSPHVRPMGAGLELFAQRHDGSEFPVDIMLSPVETDEGGQALAVVRDITTRKQAAAALRESEERFRTLANAAFESIVVSEHGRIVDANDRVFELLGVSRAELVGRAILDFVAPASRAAVAAAVGAEREEVYEFELLRKDGKTVLAEARARVMHVGQRGLRMTALRDITARRQFESDLRKAHDEAITASRLKSEFLATMSHELRTPMNGIIGMVDVLRDTKLDHEQKEFLRIVHDSGQALLEIISDFLDLSKIEAGRLRIEAAAFDLRALIEETLALLAPRGTGAGAGLAHRAAARPDGAVCRRCRSRAPGPYQSRGQRDQVHRAWPRVRAGRTRGRRGRAAPRAPDGGGHRDRHRAGGARAAVSAVHAGGRIDHSAIWWHGARARDLPATRGADGRRDRVYERTRARLDVLV